MKKITAILLGTLIASSAALAQANQVLSRNAVGYIKINFPKNSFTMVNNTFNSIGAPIAISNTFASLPLNSKIHLWNGSSYVTYNKGLAGWGAPGSNVLARGSGFWVQIPNSGTPTNYEVFVMGEVPDQTQTVTGVGPGFNMVGFPYPAETKWTNTAFAKAATLNSKLHIWNGSSYATFNRGLSGWGAATNVSINPGQGVWIQYPLTFPSSNLVNNKNYPWP